jgi:hypothetical protein
MAKIKHLIWVKREAKYFCKRGWTHPPETPNANRTSSKLRLLRATRVRFPNSKSAKQSCPQSAEAQPLFDGDGLQLAGIGDAFGGGSDDAPQRTAKAVVGPDAITSCYRNDVLLS